MAENANAFEKKKTAICVHCSADVSGVIEGVIRTLCCVPCCRAVRLPFNKACQGYHLVPTKVAKKTFYCTEDDLKTLNKSTDHELSSPLYIAAEVAYLGSIGNGMYVKPSLKETRFEVMYILRHYAEIRPSIPKAQYLRIEQQKKKERQEQIEKATMEYKMALVKMKVLSRRDLDPVVLHFLLGDFLSKGNGTVISMEDFEKRWSVLDRVEAILRECKFVHLEGAFTFCLEFPNGGPQEFQILKEKMQMVFRFFGKLIFYHASGPCPYESRRYEGTPLIEDYMEYERFYAKEILHNHLRRFEEWIEKRLIPSLCG